MSGAADWVRREYEAALARDLARPLLLLDVDGVVNHHLASEAPHPDGYEYLTTHRAGGVDVAVPVGVRARVLRLADETSVRWCTGWGREAGPTLAPALGPDALRWPAIEWTAAEWRQARLTDCNWKLRGVARAIGHRPAAWLDDNVDDAVLAWARDRSADVAPTLAVKTDPALCLQDGQVQELLAWARSL